MLSLAANDIFATKGTEYIVVLCFLGLLVPFWLALTRTSAGRAAQRAAARATRAVAAWFGVPDGVFLHPGHAWARPTEGAVVRVGVDDFASKLVGRPDRVALPPVGTRLQAGEKGWSLEVAGRGVDVLSPVEGEVVEVNEPVLADPGAVVSDPYGDGWLMAVRVPRPAALERALITGEPARGWLAGVEDDLRRRMGGELGLVVQEGGTPVAGFARELAPESWPELAAEYLHTTPRESGV